MKIVYVITKADEIGGAQIHIRDLAKKLLGDGHVVEVVVGEKGALINELEKIGVNYYIIPELVRDIDFFKDVKCVFRLRNLLKSIAPNIVSLHSSKAGVIGRAASIGLPYSVVFTAHGWSFANGVSFKSKVLYIIIEKLFSRLSDVIITVSQQDKNLALKYKVAKDEKQVVIHNGMPLIQLNKKTSNDYTTQLISVARFSNQKDHITLFYALSELNQLNWHLSLVGKGPLLPSMMQLASDLGISARITFLGERSDVSSLLDNSDIFLLISNWEGFPRSILEAMRSGLPVIASDVGGVSESVIHGETGYLVDRKSIEQIKHAINSLILDKKLSSDLGAKGALKFAKDFTFDSMYKKTLSVYNALIKEKQ
ncbi:glycosyltransferase family 4 protein [Budvicia aquatica]|uniref:GDP-mannose-dependent alpha-(1-6)-phosphatidylinositol monomannoside mannosyltransferase n=1 Tax=Budvicia aquatica TaxID=82979 RepID=A0A2C6DNA4_9GAMM|nr:glycosyltransferase family 4 protein [Budvicia aquatica]PHI31818.1 glycosyltransferase family 1 protein [Budvicia aquatica]VFS52818.1 GDP-mannose-dependent alpha-(1-6)-phosphatidylinositol monomannoside mannosyltransferase [Budvicia aquatica]